MPISTSRIFHALGLAKKGRNKRAPKPKLKKKIKDAETAPIAKAVLLRYWAEIEPNNTTVSK